ncbi:hypothetical protein AYI69_g949 [Smittium culicis]|uniref:Uncharacterized protein n=1 Tax=Smittium culicis TaxID=133412 RepID=A0A1R1YRN5_9FUNG|nr:hypothetical protein AYI69_g949 [Smittium culicis]
MGKKKTHEYDYGEQQRLVCMEANEVVLAFKNEQENAYKVNKKAVSCAISSRTSQRVCERSLKVEPDRQRRRVPAHSKPAIGRVPGLDVAGCVVAGRCVRVRATAAATGAGVGIGVCGISV